MTHLSDTSKKSFGKSAQYCIASNSYLKGLIPAFNECVDTFLEKLRGDGSACVPLDDHLRAVAQDVISKVNDQLRYEAPGIILQ